MIHSLRFIERTLEDGKVVKILQYKEAELLLCRDGQNVEARYIYKWQDVPLIKE